VELAHAQWEQLKTKVHSSEEMLYRLEVCNFYTWTKNTINDLTLVLVSEVSKDFIRIFLKQYFTALGVKAKIKENLTKLRATVKSAGLKIS